MISRSALLGQIKVQCQECTAGKEFWRKMDNREDNKDDQIVDTDHY